MLAVVHPSPSTVDNSHPHSHRQSTMSGVVNVRPRSAPSRKHPTTTSTTRSSSSSHASSSSTRQLPSAPPKPPPPPPPPALPATNGRSHSPTPFDIHSYPSTELLRLLASLLTQIASTNDKLSSPLPSHPHPPHHPTPTQSLLLQSLTSASHSSLTSPTSALTFHARNIPTISLESYLLRILKYCPTTNEVFLSLLVYFDRMSKLAAESTARTFVIDSFNVHRLVIAGVTVASKFFSDVFYTNSRYAKVGGLPQAELNQLELQFLLLNDFRLVISAEEMQRYAEQLIVFSESGGPTLHLQSPIPPANHRPPTPSHPAPTIPTTTAAPMHTMGAIDAYGGRIPSDAASSSAPLSVQNGSANNKTPSFRPQNSSPTPAPIAVPISITRVKSKPTLRTRVLADDSEPDTETETETENETEGGWTTDDEPTIRPGCGGAGGGESDCASLCSTGTEDGDGDGFYADGEDDDEDGEGREVEIGDACARGKGERTPEQKGRDGGVGGLVMRISRMGGDGDYRMASP